MAQKSFGSARGSTQEITTLMGLARMVGRRNLGVKVWETALGGGGSRG